VKLTVPIPTEIDVDAIEVTIPLKAGEVEAYTIELEEDGGGLGRLIRPMAAPRYDLTHEVVMVLDLNTRKVRDWTHGAMSIDHGVVDAGTYRLLRGSEVVRVRGEDYAPECMPGGGGDYIEMEILPDGSIRGWAPKPREVLASFWATS
jgi:hypothetical protein